VKGGPDEPSSDSQGPIPLGEMPQTHERGTMREAAVEERGASTLSQARSLQSRLSNLLAMGLIGALSVGLIGWYYAKILSRPSNLHHAARAAAQVQAEGDMRLPSLGKVEPPEVIASVLGPKPEAPPEYAPEIPLPPSSMPASVNAAPKVPTSQELELARRLSGAVSTNRPASSVASVAPVQNAQGSVPVNAPDAQVPLPQSAPEPVARESALASRLKPSATPAVAAKMLPTQRLLLPKGAFIDCTLETAMNSSLPGMTTCVTATDTFGADGSVVLLERGTKLVGESAGAVQRGSARMFVLWTEARTPKGVVIPLASPGTDELGRSGLSGDVNRHFFERFGAAILITLIDGAVQRASNGSSGNGTVILNPSGTQDITTEVLKSTVDIPPTIDKHQGDRIQVLVARDLDFRTVYELKPSL
jgi:type IV secretion system protein VirB10